MQHQAMFSIGDYELETADFATLQSGSMGQKFYVAPQKPIAQNPNSAIKTKIPQPNNSVSAMTYVPGKGKTYVKTNAKGVRATMGTGVRKGHIRNIGGKAVMVGQSILKAGKNTAGSLSSAAKANPRIAIAAGATSAIAGLGAGYAASRKKRKRR